MPSIDTIADRPDSAPVRMQGTVGYKEIAGLVESGGTMAGDGLLPWFEYRSRCQSGGAKSILDLLHHEGLRHEKQAIVSSWVADGCPLLPGKRYAAYFFELDAWSEYWDIYHPETDGRYHFGNDARPGYLSTFLPDPAKGRSPVFDAWKAYAFASGEEGEDAARARFENLASTPEVTEAVLAVDALVRDITGEHFGSGDSDARLEAYFDGIERFARDTLPACPDRTARLPEGDARTPFSGSHMMAGDIMWFAWAVHLHCAQLRAPPVSADTRLRTLLMAGVALGCSMDYTFSRRCRTRQEYEARDQQTWGRIWERGRRCASDFDTAAAEVRDLFRIRTFGDA